MKHARLDLARSADLLPPLDGAIGVFGQIDLDRLRGLDGSALHCVSRSFVTSNVLSGAGLDVSHQLDHEINHAVVFLPRAKAEGLDLIATAVLACPQGWIVVDGQKTDGIESIAKQIGVDVETVGSYSKGHGKTIWFRGADAQHLGRWMRQAEQNANGYLTAPGVFSADAIDPASEMLAQHLPENLMGRVVDLGAGWGYLSAQILLRCAGVISLDLVEDNALALDCARNNVVSDKAQFHWADALTWKARDPVDSVVMNPPFHTSRSAEPALGIGFIHAAARLLRPGGRLFMVANAHLPYEQALEHSFEHCELLVRSSQFKIYCATRGRGKLG